MKINLSSPLFVLSLFVANVSLVSAADKPVLLLNIVKNTLASVNAKDKQQGRQFAVAVVDDGGNLLYAERPEEVAPGMTDVSVSKAQTAARYGIATRLIEEQITKGRVSYLSLPAAVPIEGGIPILQRGHIVGAIGIAGSTSDVDEAAAQAFAAALTEAVNTTGR